MGRMLLNRSNGCWLDVYDAERFTGNTRRYDRPPFAHEAGYAAYMLWAASHLAKMKE